MSRAIRDRQYTHYKNQKRYLVLSIAKNPNTKETIVVYREMGEVGNHYFRPLKEFEEKFTIVPSDAPVTTARSYGRRR